MEGLIYIRTVIRTPQGVLIMQEPDTGDIWDFPFFELKTGYFTNQLKKFSTILGFKGASWGGINILATRIDSELSPPLVTCYIYGYKKGNYKVTTNRKYKWIKNLNETIGMHLRAGIRSVIIEALKQVNKK